MKRLLFFIFVLAASAQAQWLGSYATGDSVTFPWTCVDSTIKLEPVNADTVVLLRFRQPSGASPVLVDSVIYHSGTTPALASLQRGTGHYLFRAKASDGSNTLGIYLAEVRGWDFINSKRVYGLFKTYGWSCGGSYNEVRIVSSDTTGNLTVNSDKTGYRLSATGVDEIWDELQSGHTTAGSFGKRLDKDITAVDDNPWDNPVRTLTSGAGSGSNQVTLTVKRSSDSTVLNGVETQILNQSQSATEGLLTTNSLGQAVFALNNGTYKVRLFKPGYVFTVPESVIVSGTAGGTFYGAAFDPGTPPSPALCRVYGYVKDINNLPVVGAKIEALNKTVPLKYQSVIVSPYYKNTTTDSNGYWFLDLFPNSILTPSDSKYRFNIHVPSGAVLNLEASVPNQSSWQLTF